MAKSDKKPSRIRPRLPRGFADRDAADIRAVDQMMGKIKGVYERYGFDPVETPFFEYTEALGKFLPDSDRPNEGVFSLQDDDDQWLSLRYDLTAPLARYVAEHYNDLPKPYRSYRSGWVFRNEKPGPGRFRQFMQMDADTVGTSSVAADAEMAMMMADVMEAVGLEGQYIVRVNSRRVLDGILDSIGLAGPGNDQTRLTVLRALDKFDRLHSDGVRHLLMDGRVDESGDFTKGAGLDRDQADILVQLLDDQWLAFLVLPDNLAIHNSRTYEQYLADFEPEDPADWESHEEYLENAVTKPSRREDWEYLQTAFVESELEARNTSLEYLGKLEKSRFTLNRKFREGMRELFEIVQLCSDCGYSALKIRPDITCVRGLEYYTGPVFEADLTFETVNEKGKKVIFGSVGGGGRYDGLVGRFKGENVPATGFSIGVSRLASALKNLGKLGGDAADGPVIVTVMDKGRIADYQRMTAELRGGLNKDRKPGDPIIPVEMYLGNPKKFGKQLEYADKRNSPCVVIQGEDEIKIKDPETGEMVLRETPIVIIKDMIEGKKKAAAIADNQEWRDERPGQFEVAADDLVAEVAKLLARQKAG